MSSTLYSSTISGSEMVSYHHIAAVSSPLGEVRLYKVCDWYFVIQFYPDSEDGKFLLCLGVEHAITIFDACAERLVQWEN